MISAFECVEVSSRGAIYDGHEFLVIEVAPVIDYLAVKEMDAGIGCSAANYTHPRMERKREAPSKVIDALFSRKHMEAVA